MTEPQRPPRLVELFGYQGLLMEARMAWLAFEYAARGLDAPNYEPFSLYDYWYPS